MGSFEDEDLNKEGYLGDVSIPEKGFGGVFRYTETWGGGVNLQINTHNTSHFHQ